MAVTVVDPAAGALAQALGKLGEGLALRFTEKQRREKELSADPIKMQGLAAAYRAAGVMGQGEQFLNALNVRPEFGAALAAFPETTAEILERERLARGYAGEQARGEVATTVANRMSAEELIRIDGPMKIAYASVQEAILRGMTADEAIDQNLAFLNTAAIAAQRTFERNSFSYQDELITHRRMNGIDITELDFANVTNKLGLGAATVYRNYFDSLPQGSHERTTAAMALSNPNQLTHIQFHENLDFQTTLRNQTVIGDKIALTLKLREAWATAIKNATTAVDDGVDKTILDAWAQDINTLSFMIRDAESSGLISPIDVAEARRAGDEIRFTPKIFASEIVGGIADNLWAQGIRTQTELEAYLVEQIPELEGKSRETALDPRSLSQLRNNWNRFAGVQEAIERAKEPPGAFGAGTAGRALIQSPVTGFMDSMRKDRSIQTLMQGYQFLSTEMKEIIDRMALPYSGPGRQF